MNDIVQNNEKSNVRMQTTELFAAVNSIWQDNK